MLITKLNSYKTIVIQLQYHSGDDICKNNFSGGGQNPFSKEKEGCERCGYIMKLNLRHCNGFL